MGLNAGRSAPAAKAGIGNVSPDAEDLVRVETSGRSFWTGFAAAALGCSSEHTVNVVCAHRGVRGVYLGHLDQASY
eukprot:SAG11_NODE_5654_length_1494_cov_1.362007_2_plen_76_part_00